MDVLKPWLAATIEGELSEAIRYKGNSTNNHQSTEKSQGLSYDDGSNLRIPSAKKGPVVQITKFLTFEEPIQVTLSDSMIRINASITSQASQRYAKEKRRQLTEGTVGGLIQLHEFEIVATHLGPRDKRLTLYVKHFKSLGSNGSGDFGVAPQAIESRAGTKELLNKLADLRRHEPDAHFKQHASASPIRSQPSTQTSEAGINQDSQAGFATQLPRLNAPAISKLKPHDPITSIKIRSSSTANTIKSLITPTKDKSGNLSASTLNSFQIQAAPQGPSVSDKTALLLGLLKNHGRAPPEPELIPEPIAEQPRARNAVLTRPTVIQGGNEASGDINLASSDENASGAPIGIQKRKRSSPDNNPRKKAADDDDSERVDEDCESLVLNHDLDKKARSGAAVKEASTNTLHSQPASPSRLDVAKLHPNALLDHPVLSIPKLASSVSGRGPGRNQISRRDVNIPKAQETLLNRADSWLPAEPGQREPMANIPISLLKTLNRKADLRAERATRICKQRNGTVIANAGVDQTTDSGSDVPVSSGRWPESPERDQLPPDSSLASAEHLDHSAQNISNIVLPVSTSRRQSHASNSSHSMPSERPSPVSAKYFSGESGSPSLLSPSVTSTSAGEEVHRFSCQVPGCNKSYKKSGSLRYHVDRHHPGTRSFENFKCSVGDCNRSYPSLGGLEYHIERHHDGNKAPSSPSESATPIVSAASTPMLPGLTGSSEHNGRPGQEIVDDRSDNESEHVASTLSLIERGSWTAKEKQTVRRRSCTNTVLKHYLPPDQQPTLVHSVAIDRDETHVAKVTSSPLRPASPTPESDLEMTIPLALNESIGSIVNSAPMQSFPSTASQKQHPFTQVERTPYVNGHVHNKSLPGSRALFSHLKADHPLPNDTINDNIEFVSASYTTGPELSIGESNSKIGISQTVENQVFEDQCIENPAARLGEKSNGQHVTDNTLEKSEQLIGQVQRESRKVEAAAGKPADSSNNIIGHQGRDPGSSKLCVASKASAKPQVMSGKLLTLEDSHIDPLLQGPASDQTAQFAHEMKRKIVDSSLSSPGPSKRQKRFKVPRAFKFIERSEIPRDPSEGARQYRQDFLASRRSSESGTPTMSPTISSTVVPEITSEKSRYTSERPQQVHQEFLASRSSSETTTPSTSPRKHSNAATGPVQADQQNTEAEKRIENVTLQKNSVDAENGCQKMMILGELSARSPRQEKKLDAAPLSNGVASIETDGHHAKPGAQDDATLDDKADSFMFVAQNSDIEGPCAEQITVNEASCYSSIDEAQRVQCLELDLSFQSQDQQEAKSDLTGVKHDADQTVSVRFDPLVASHDQLANTDEEWRSLDLDQEKSRKCLPTRADEGTEQGSNAPRPDFILDQVAEPNTGALECAHQQPSIEKDTDTPMPDVQMNQGITALKPVDNTDEPINQNMPLSFAATTFVTGSNSKNQPHVSSAPVDLAIPFSDPILDFEVRITEERQNAVQLPIEIVKQKQSSLPANIFDKFKATYPAYPGDMNHFAAICRKISQLVKANLMEHQSLWDDFIVRHKVEYPLYLRRCAEEAEDVVSYEEFYQNGIEEPRYQKHVISRRTLDDALALVPQKSSIEQVRVEPVNSDEPRAERVEYTSISESDPGAEKIHSEYVPANDDEPLESVPTKSATKPATSDETARKLSESRVTIDISTAMMHNKTFMGNEPRIEPAKATSALKEATFSGTTHNSCNSRITIDLTEDDPSDDPPESTKARQTPPNSSVPNQDFQDSSGNLYKGSHTTPTMQGSSVPPHLRSYRSRLMADKSPESEAFVRNRRCLPWKGSDPSGLQSSPNAITSDSPKQFPGSDLRGSNNADDLCYQVSPKSAPKGVKQTQDLLNNCHKVIQSNWGIKAHELLEPGYRRGQVLSETMIEFLAEIAGKVNVDEARNQIKKAIDTRVRDNVWRGAGHPIQDRRMLKSDLEVVRKITETSSMSTMSPFPLPHTNAAVEKQNEISLSKWWDDENSPFKSFARAYASIRHGKGNSFAKADSAEPSDAEKVHETTSSGVQLKKINIMRWNL